MLLFSHLIRQPYILFDKDEGGGGDSSKSGDPGATDDTSGGDDAKKGGGGSDDDKDKKGDKPQLSELMKDPDFKKQMDDWGNSFVQDRLDRDRKDREKKADKDKEKELEEQKKFETLAEQRGTKIVELESNIESKDEEINGLKGQLEEANKALSAYIEKLKAGVDESVIELLDGKSPAEQLAWLVKHTANSEDEDDGKDKKKPIPSTPQPGDVGEAAKKQRREMGKEEASRRYKKKW